MKKLFKKGLIALTLIAGMTFAVPQQAKADAINGTPIGHKGKGSVHTWVEGTGTGLTDIIYFYDGNGNLTKVIFVYDDGRWETYKWGYWGIGEGFTNPGWGWHYFASGHN